MKNLKRVLSLGLASVMLLGMMVVGASAKDFTDAESIEHTEAVQVLVALSVVNGKEDGSYFDPNGSVTRGEMAKMIAVLMNGGNETNTGVKTTPSFTDIAGHWAEPWIEYCADMKIINGVGDGSFNPNGLVTGTEALKMVLTALGYDAEAYRLIGAGWAAQTMERARNTGFNSLLDNLDNVVFTEAATRDTAAQIIWNGLQAEAVTTTPQQNTSNGEVTWQYGKTGASLLKQRYKADIATGTYFGNDKSDASCEDGQISIEYGDGPSYYYVPSDLGIENIGEEVKVVWKDNATKGTKGALDKDDTIYGVFNTGATRVVTTTMGKMKDHKNDKKQINLNGTVANVADEVAVYINYQTTPAKTFANSKGTGDGVDGVAGKAETASANAQNSGLTKYLKQDRGDTIKAVFDEDGKVTKIYITESKLASVSSINSTNITMNSGVGSIKIADNDVESGLKKGDVVVVTTLYAGTATSTGAYTIVKKAEKVSGEVEAYNGNETITLSGTKYTIYKKQAMIDVVDADNVITDLTADNGKVVGKDFDLYLVNGYVGAAVRTSADASNYSVITEVKSSGSAGSTFDGLQLQVLTADGTKEIISVSKDSEKKNATDYKVGMIITYSFDKDDLADVKIKSDVKTDAQVKYNSNTKSVNNIVTAADCVLFVQTASGVTFENQKANGAEWAAYTIRDLDSITLASGELYSIAYNSDNDKVVAVFMNYKDTPNGAGDTSVYGIISAANGRVADDYYSFTVQSNGDTYTILHKNAEGLLAKGKLVKFNPTTDNKYGANSVKVYAASAGTNKIAINASNVGYVKEFSTRDNTLTYVPGVGNVGTDSDDNYTVEKVATKTYALAKDATIIYIDANGSKSESEASVDHWSEYTGNANVMFTTKMDGDDEVIAVMFVETSTRKHVNANVK